tara:strand:+ start:2505 stop:2879 length:375 start_codon:yes stop_codon:yes gene_type:complete
MEDFLYVITEKDGSNEICSSQVINELYMSDSKSSSKDSSERAAIELDYEMNTTVVSLNKIMDFYNIPSRENRRELKKQEKIQRIVNFETDNGNQDVVKKRKRYWEYIKELKEDDYFKKYIVIDL